MDASEWSTQQAMWAKVVVIGSACPRGRPATSAVDPLVPAEIPQRPRSLPGGGRRRAIAEAHAVARREDLAASVPDGATDGDGVDAALDELLTKLALARHPEEEDPGEDERDRARSRSS